MPLVSVVIPAFDRSSVVGCAVQSVLGQTFRDLEVIVVDDGSKDETRPSIEQLAIVDPRVRLLSHPYNRGAQAARNTGAQAARGRWLAFLDSDDTWLPQSLEVRLAYAQKHDFKVVHTPGYVLRSGGEQKMMVPKSLSGNSYEKALRGEMPLYPAMLFTAEAYRAIGGFDESIISHQEWDTAILLARRHKFGFLPEPTFVYDCRGADTISKDKTRAARGYEQIVRKHVAEILTRAGPQAIANHYIFASHLYRAAGDYARADRCRTISWLWWPAPDRMVRALKHRFRAETPGSLGEGRTL